MKFTFTRESMLKGLQRVMGAVPTKMPMPSLGNLHLKLEDNTLDITATDLEITVTSRVELLESEGSGGVLIQAKRFFDLVRELKDVPLEIEVQEPLKIVIKGEGTGEYTIPGGDPIDFPELPPVDAQLTFDIPAEVLKRMVSKTVFAVSHDDMRPILTGLLVEIRPNELRLVATDGHRLSRISHVGIDYSGDARDVVVPMKAFNLLMRTLEDEDNAQIGIAETRASFSNVQHRLTTRLIDGTYPRYTSVIPENNPNRLIVDAGLLQASVKRVSIFANQISHQVKLTLDSTRMKLESEDPEIGGRGEEEMPVDYSGESLEIAYNANYLLDVLKHIDTEDAHFELNGTNDAAVIRPSSQEENEEQLMLLMPIRLR